MSIEAGKLRERITIQQKNLVDNGRGGRKRPDGEPEWIDIDEIGVVRAEIIPLRGDEALSNLILRTVQLYRVTIRNRPGILPTHRLMWGETAMNIKSLTRSADRREIVMTAETGTPG